MRFEDTVLFSPDAGVARAAVALVELERRIVAAGGEVRWSTPALRIEEDSDGVTVHTDAGVVRADTVVVTAGAWTEHCWCGGIPLPPLVVTEESPAHFAPRDPADAWPSFNHFVTPGAWPANVYGMPTPGEGVKVGFHAVGDVVDPDARPFRTDKHAAQLAEYVREWMPGLDPDTAAPISCTYTSTPDEAFVLDRRRPDRGRRRILGPGLQVRAGRGRRARRPRAGPRVPRGGGVPPALTAPDQSQPAAESDERTGIGRRRPCSPNLLRISDSATDGQPYRARTTRFSSHTGSSDS